MARLLVIAVLMVAGVYLFKRLFGTRNGYEEQRQQGELFLEKNLKSPDVQQHESGLQYQWLQKNPSNITANLNDQVTVHYHGTLLNGDVFDSSTVRGQPATFKVSQLVKGWQIALQMMGPGDKMRVFVPEHLAYGKRKAGKIPAGATLIFDLELLSIGWGHG